MKKIFTSILIIIAASFYTSAQSFAATKNEEVMPTINISNVSTQEPTDNQSKPLKVKTTILTKKNEKTIKFEKPQIKKEKIDVELTSDVDKILKEMDIDDIDPAEGVPQTPIEKVYKPVKKNFFWIAVSIILFPVILFILLIKTMQLAKNRFEEEKEGPSKEEQFLDEIEKAQKTTKKKRRSLGEILGHHPKERLLSSKISKIQSYEDDFNRVDEDFEFMVEEVVLVEEKKEPKTLKPKYQESKPLVEKIEKPQTEQKQKSASSEITDSFEISEKLKFVLIQKNNSTNLVCQINDNEVIIMKLEKAQKINKVRKIDSKPGRDVYMIKLDSWRGLVEVKENSVKYLMDI